MLGCGAERSTSQPAPRWGRASRGTLLTVLGASSSRPVVATVSGARVPSAAASTASASSAPASPASFLGGKVRCEAVCSGLQQLHPPATITLVLLEDPAQRRGERRIPVNIA